MSLTVPSTRASRRPHEFAGPVLTLAFVVCFLPYLSFGPLSVPSQVQPWAALLAWGWVAMRALSRGVKVTGTQLVLIVFSLWFMLYVYAGQGFDLTVYFRRSAAFFLSAGIFLAAQYLTPQRLWRVLKLTLPIWFGFAVLRYASPSTYFAIVQPLVPTVIDSNLRGSSSLAPEATDFGFTMVFMVIFCLITRSRLRDEGVNASKWPLFLAVGAALLSQSGTGIFGLALIVVFYLAVRPARILGKSGRVMALLLAVVVGYLGLVGLGPTEIRGLDLLATAVRDPLSLMNTTASYRVVHNAVGVLGMVDSGFRGYGAGAFIAEAPGVYYRHSLGSVFGLTGYYAMNVPITLGISPISFFAVILLEYGLVGVAYIAFLFRFMLRSSIPFKSVSILLMAVAWAQSFPAAWPPFWVLLGLMMSPHFRAPRPSPEAAPSTPEQARSRAEQS